MKLTKAQQKQIDAAVADIARRLEDDEYTRTYLTEAKNDSVSVVIFKVWDNADMDAYEESERERFTVDRKGNVA